ncbi:ScbA/BarX family gamma-butyrolactone biosynthesis protein [Streptomyces sp. NPDC051041]|uniref:ScbA/BarX family gamma-butyrolactone biosynthesis protein n=1 Tax=Streptomyces sp. NPDC051041 TaxID=3365640 RepID=UPI00379E0BBC
MASDPPRPSAVTAPPPRLTATVPREYVHRASVAEVFLTGGARHGDTRFEVTGQWPRAHTFFQSADGRDHDPLLTAETFRQAGLFLAHTELGVPLGHHFVMRDLTFTARLDRLGIGPSPTDVELTVDCPEVIRRGRTTSGFRMELAIRRDGGTVATGGGRFTCVSPAVYRRLRGARPTGPGTVRPRAAHTALPPAAVGRTRPDDVVLFPTPLPDTWLLTPDPAHPILFDHDCDHVPGMVLLEAARQAACHCVAPGTMRPSAMSTAFHRYAELDQPCWIEAALVPSGEPDTVTVRVTGRQGGREVFSSTVTGPVDAVRNDDRVPPAAALPLQREPQG